jgi:hypothetical protein
MFLCSSQLGRPQGPCSLVLYFRLKFPGMLPETPKECQSQSLFCASGSFRQGQQAQLLNTLRLERH